MWHLEPQPKLLVMLKSIFLDKQALTRRRDVQVSLIWYVFNFSSLYRDFTLHHLINSHPLVSFINLWIYNNIFFFLSFFLRWQVGSNTNSKPSDQALAYCKTSSSQHDTTMPLLGHSSSQQVTKSDNQEIDHHPQLASHSQAVPFWLYGLIDSQLKTAHATKPNSPNAAPNLELTLAAPKPLEQNKSSTAPLLMGPITVTWTFRIITHRNVTPSRSRGPSNMHVIHGITSVVGTS